MARAKVKRQSKCTPELIEKICLLVEEKTGWKKIAKVLSIGERTLEYWRDKKSEFYQPELVAAIEAVQEGMSCGKIKGNQHIEANKHVLKRRIKEPRVIDVRTKGLKRKQPPPAMPPSNFKKAGIIRYADDVLDLILDPEFTKEEMRIECRKRIEELSEEIMVTVRVYEQEVDANAQAVKNVLTNCGPKKDRWNFGQEHIVDASDPLKKLLEQIATGEDALPSEEKTGE